MTNAEYLNTLKPGERVMETTRGSALFGKYGSVYISHNPGTEGSICVRWDDTGLGTSATHGTRRVENVEGKSDPENLLDNAATAYDIILDERYQELRTIHEKLWDIQVSCRRMVNGFSDCKAKLKEIQKQIDRLCDDIRLARDRAKEESDKF